MALKPEIPNNECFKGSQSIVRNRERDNHSRFIIPGING